MRSGKRLKFLMLLLSLCLSVTVAMAQQASLFLKYNNQAKAEKALSHYAQAEQAYQAALNDARLGSSYKSILVLNYVDLCFLRGDYQTAQSLLDSHAPQSEEQRTRWQVRQAAVKSFMRHYDEADRLFAQVLSQPQLDAAARYEALTYRAAMCMDTHRYAQALSLFTKATALAETPRERTQLLIESIIPLAHCQRQTEALQRADSCVTWCKRNLPAEHHLTLVALRKKAEVLLLMNDKARAAKVFRTYFDKQRSFVKNNFGQQTEQWRLDFWKTQKPWLTEVMAVEEADAQLVADVALFRREVALLGNADSAKMQQLLSVTSAQISQCLKTNEAAIDFVVYSKPAALSTDTAEQKWYGAVVVTPKRKSAAVKFVPLFTLNQLHAYPVGGIDLKTAVCSQRTEAINQLYADSALCQLVWGKLRKEVKGYSHLFFAPDGLLQLLGIEHLAGAQQLGQLHRVSSLARLINRHRTSQTAVSQQVVTSVPNTLLVGGLDYNALDPMPATPANHESANYLQNYLHAHGNLFAPLKGTYVEIASIESEMPQCEKRTTEFETGLQAKLTSGHYRQVHLATHGYALQVDYEDEPYALRDSLTEDKSLWASGLALSGANVSYRHEQLADNILSARELCELNLSGIDLIVLSACQTALGKVSDEGPAGLLRGLKKAGAHAVIASLWEVSDKATALFMKHFYAAYRQSGFSDKATALRKAQQQLREYTVTRQVTRFDPQRKINVADPSLLLTTHPFEAPIYWAGFILIDNL